MELRQLRYFVAVAEEKNISRAAQKIFLTQPALSRQIRALENELGQCLLERQAHSIRLTSAGETLLREARTLLQQAEELIDRVRASGRDVRLRVGYAPSFGSGLLSCAVEHFAQRHPAARVELLDLSTKEILAGIENSSLDIALTAHPGREPASLRWTKLLSSPWQLALNRQHAFARRASITPADVTRGPLLVFCQRDYPEYWETIVGWLRAHQHRPVVAGEYDGVTSLLAAVESGLGIALVTSCTARLLPERVRLKPLTTAPAPVQIAACIRADRASEKPLAVFIEELKNAAQTFSEQAQRRTRDP